MAKTAKTLYPLFPEDINTCRLADRSQQVFLVRRWDALSSNANPGIFGGSNKVLRAED